MRSLNETIRIEGVWKTYPSSSFPALQEVSFSFSEGSHVALVGPDGAGKTTLLKMLAGILRPDKGRVELFGNTWEESALLLKEQIGYLPQQPGIYGELSVQENLEFFADLQGVHPSKERIEELLVMTQLVLFRKRLARKLSGGMFQKLALACALIHRPRLLLLDEPTTGVDPVARREFHGLLDQLRKEGVTLCMATPAMDEASRCNPVVLLYEGRLMAHGDPIWLSKQVRGSLYEVLSQNPRQIALKLKARHPAWNIQVFGDRLHVTIPEEEESRLINLEGGGTEGRMFEQVDVRRKSLENIRASISPDEGPVQVRPIKPSLEDVFLELTYHSETGGTYDAEER